MTYTTPRVATLQITCITLAAYQSGYEAITAIGGASFYKSKWEAIGEIEAGTHRYFTKVNGKRAEVAVRVGNNGKFLQTHADGYWNNNLLALLHCR